MRGAGAGQPTPWVGALERVNIGAVLLWVGLLAGSMVRLREPAPVAPQLASSG
jgi:hypothetical protein